MPMCNRARVFAAYNIACNNCCYIMSKVWIYVGIAMFILTIVATYLSYRTAIEK